MTVANELVMGAEWATARLVGRIDRGSGPSPVLIEKGEVYDMAAIAPTVSELLENKAFRAADGEHLGPLDNLDLFGSAPTARLLSPIDLQCVKACGVTFAVSALERVIEERARGDHARADAIRGQLEDVIGGSIRSVVPGTEEAAALKQALIDDGMWSQYLEVAIGPDAEVFTKSPILSTVGWGAQIGVRSDSTWNNPEPEIVLVVDSKGEVIGATLGNDVNLRDFEGRSALLLGKAKDNNASCAIGPFIRLFSDDFGIDDIRAAEVELAIEGPEGFSLKGVSRMSEISRDPLDLVRQTMSEHSYPDGFVLFLGTLFAPTDDRDKAGYGFTHKQGDKVSIFSPRLGTLQNTVTTSELAPPWKLGVTSLMRNLAGRGLLV